MKRFKPLAITVLASQLLAVTQVADARRASPQRAQDFIANPASSAYQHGAHAAIKATQISIRAVCGGTLTRTAVITERTLMPFSLLLGANGLSDQVGLDTTSVLQRRAAVLFALKPTNPTALGGPLMTYTGPAGSFVTVSLFSPHGFIYRAMASLGGGNYTPINNPELPANAAATTYSAESLFGAQVTAVPEVGTVQVEGTPVAYFALAVAYEISANGTASAISLSPEQVEFSGGWTIAG